MRHQIDMHAGTSAVLSALDFADAASHMDSLYEA